MHPALVEPPGKAIQSSFAGGMNMILDETHLGDNQYVYGFNIRTRYDTVAAVNDSVEDTAAPEGLKQGIFSIGELLVLFVAGKAYYKDISASDAVWTEIPGISLKADATRIYTEVVPVSSLNASRAASELNGLVLNFSSASASSPAGMVVQDGESQPWIIFQDGTARVLGTYRSWNSSAREYVPIGKQMLYAEGRLYVVAADGSKVYRSVTGRPLDFVIAIDKDGGKVADAEGLPLAVAFDKITTIAAMNSGELFIANNRRSVVATVDNGTTYFGEPTFTFRAYTSVGCVGQYSFLDILGDYAFIDGEGVRSFNAVQTLRFEGRNAAFSLNVSPAFKDIIQDDNSATISYDNYALFSLTTIYGEAILVYDILNKVYVSFDIISAKKKIHQFATTFPYKRALYGITDDKVYTLYSGNPLLATLRTRAWTSGNAGVNIQTAKVNLKYNTPTEKDGTVRALLLVDGMRAAALTIPARVRDLGIGFPVEFPVNFDSDRSIFPVCANFTSAKTTYGWKIGMIIKWDCGGTLTDIEFDLDTQETAGQDFVAQRNIK